MRSRTSTIALMTGGIDHDRPEAPAPVVDRLCGDSGELPGGLRVGLVACCLGEVECCEVIDVVTFVAQFAQRMERV